MKDIMIRSFNRIALLEDKWDHNQQYSKLILKEIKPGIERALDIGCGTGEFTKKIAMMSKEVIGIDIADQMILEAKKRHQSENIRYILQDFDVMDEKEHFDCIVSIAAFHHLSLDTALPKIKRMLNPGGTLIVLDLYKRRGILDLFLDIIAVPLSKLIKTVNRSGRMSREEIEAWKEHCRIDKYLTIKELRQIYYKYLDKSVKIKRLVFWRYFALYRKSHDL